MAATAQLAGVAPVVGGVHLRQCRRRPPGWNAARTARKVAVTEIACALRVTERAAETLMEEARTLVGTLPATLEALSAGKVSYAHASILADESWSLPVVTAAEVKDADPTLTFEAAQTLARELTAQVVAEFEATTLPVAASTTPSRFRHRARQARERMHPATIETRNAAKVADRHVRLEPARDGMAWLVGVSARRGRLRRLRSPHRHRPHPLR